MSLGPELAKPSQGHGFGIVHPSPVVFVVDMDDGWHGLKQVVFVHFPGLQHGSQKPCELGVNRWFTTSNSIGAFRSAERLTTTKRDQRLTRDMLAERLTRSRRLKHIVRGCVIHPVM